VDEVCIGGLACKMDGLKDVASRVVLPAWCGAMLKTLLAVLH